MAQQVKDPAAVQVQSLAQEHIHAVDCSQNYRKINVTLSRGLIIHKAPFPVLKKRGLPRSFIRSLIKGFINGNIRGQRKSKN